MRPSRCLHNAAKFPEASFVPLGESARLEAEALVAREIDNEKGDCWTGTFREFILTRGRDKYG
jgi:hypothetical protein